MKNLSLYFLQTLCFLALGAGMPAQAQQDRNPSIIRLALKGWEYKVKAGINIGGTSPLPLPVEIRDIKKYNPTLAFSIEGAMAKWINEKWGIQTAVRLETKSMKTDARVKNYSMEMISTEDGYLKGRWTGNIRTNVDNTYVTLPFLALYRAGKRVNLKAGLFVSYLLDGAFSGTAYDGYLRNGDPTGTRYRITRASYDFSDDLRDWAWGATLGVDWRAFKHLSVFADLNWGVNDIFKAEFKTITFDMYPIYLNTGFGYAF